MNAEPMQAAAPSPTGTAAVPEKKKASSKRRGVVLVAVLIVVASLSLAGYHYGDLMTSEYKASEFAHKNVQAKALAESGIHYTAALLSDPDAYNATLGGNPWNNPDRFKNQEIRGNNKLIGKFSVIAPDPDDAMNVLYGVSDESGKINLNAVMRSDPSGDTLYNMLLKLKNMTEEIANAIVDWLDADNDPRTGGAETDYYQGRNPPYRCKNGPIDSIDELLLVKGVTRQLLYGADANRNGFQDGNQEGGLDGFDRGWSAYLTVHSREQNVKQDGTPLVWLNHTDPKEQYDWLLDIVGEDMAKFVYLCRRRGCKNSSNPLDGLKGYAIKPISEYTPDFEAFALKIALSPSSMYDFGPDACTPFQLIDNAYVRDDSKKTIYLSPLKDYAQNKELLGKFLGAVTYQNPVLNPDDPMTGPEIPARINVRTASRQVLDTLADGSLTLLTSGDIDKIMEARKNLDPTSPTSDSTAWLLEAQIPLKTLRDPNCYKRITARTQVYRVQSVGYFEGKGPAIRVEAVIDTNSGRPRILAWRDLSELGKGWSDNPP